MADDNYQKKLGELQSYIPFLENTIKRLKNECGKPREAQITKLQSLLQILTNTKKKLKYDALKKCEEVILKLYEKVEKKPSLNTMHKYTCRTPPEDKFPFDREFSLPNLDNEVAFAVARQKLNKQAELADLTPASPSPPLSLPISTPKPVVIPTEKVATTHQEIVKTANKNKLGKDFTEDIWTNNFADNLYIAPRTINWPNRTSTQHENRPVYSTQTSFSGISTPCNNFEKFDVWNKKNMNISKIQPHNREIVDYSDNFGEDLDPSPNLIQIKTISGSNPKLEPPLMNTGIKKQIPEAIILEKTLDPIKTSLNKPPLSDSDLKALLSSSNSPSSGACSPIVNEDMDLDKLEEIKAKLCKELEENKKKCKESSNNKPNPKISSSTCTSTSNHTTKPKAPKVIERVVKEQDNIFGNLLSSIDKQIISKTKENTKKTDKKDSKTKDHKSKDEKSDRNTESHKSSSSKDKERHKDSSRTKEKSKSSKDCSKTSKTETKHKKDDSKQKTKETKDGQIKKPDETLSKTVEKIMKDLKESVKKKAHEAKDLQENLVKNDKIVTESKSDENIPSSGRISDKYPHKRKPSLEKHSESPIYEQVPNKTLSKPLTTEVHPSKLFDPRLKSSFTSPPQNNKIISPENVPYNNNGPRMQNSLNNRPLFFPNERMNCPQNVDNFQANLGSLTPKDPFSTGFDVDMRLEPQNVPFVNNFNNWNRPPEPNRYQTYPNQRYPQNNIPSGNYSNQDPKYSQYDLSQMNPIDFFESHEKAESRLPSLLEMDYQSRSFRGRGVAPNQRGFRGRGTLRNIQWVNPIRRQSTNEENYNENRKSGSSRYPTDSNKNQNEDLSKDPRKYTKFEDLKPTKSSIETKAQNEEKSKDPRKYTKLQNEDTKKNSSNDRKSEESEKSECKETFKKKEEISSPLNSLYSTETKQIGKGYGLQKFKIPKIRKSVDEVKEEAKKDLAKQPEVTKEEEIKADKVDDKKVEDIKDDKPETTNETITETDEKLEMFNKFMKHIFDTCDSSVLLQYLDKCGFSLPQAKTKRIRRIIESDSESDENDQKDDTVEEKTTEIEVKSPEKTEKPINETTGEENDEIIQTVGERIKNRRRNQLVSYVDSSPEKNYEEENPKVLKEKNKNPPKTRRKNALELLQEDIREMFISEGVLTASGKRMCRIMREHQESGLYTDLKPSKKQESSAVEDDEDMPLSKRKSTLKAPKTKKSQPEKNAIKRTRSSPRVVLEKMTFPLEKYSSESEIEPEVSKPEPKKPIRRTRRFASSEPVLLELNEAGDAVISDKNKPKTKTDEAEEVHSPEKPKVHSPEKPKVQSPEKPKVHSPEKPKVVRKKKKGRWSQGVIKKSKSKLVKPILSSQTSTEISEPPDLEIDSNPAQNSDNDEFSLLKIDTAPDVNYFLDNGNRFDCKLCDYRGKLIVHHYRTKHPESENMISRLNPEQAELAKKESLDNDFESLNPCDEYIKGKKRRTTFICRFCSLTFKQEFTSSFFDHICCHTGEYRYSCEICSFYTGVKKTLSTHYHNIHPNLKKPIAILPTWAGPPNFRIVFGYLCKACNFTQLLKPNLEKHIKVSHLGQNIEIVKISMSSRFVSLSDIKNTLDGSVNLENSLDESSTVEQDDYEEENKTQQTKEPDMTVFLESNDFSLQEKIIENERLQKMQEVISNITPRRSTLNFVDKLKNKLQSVFSTTEDQPEEEPAEEPTQTVSESSIVEKVKVEDAPEEIMPEELNLKIASTCSLANLENSDNENNSEEEVDESMDISDVQLSFPVDTKQKGVLDTIHRLAKKLQSPKQQNLEVNNLEKVINVGVIEVLIGQNEQKYSCLVPGCNFTALYKLSFTKHCSEVHQKLTVFCQICNKSEPEQKPFTMSSLFVHLFDRHKENAKNDLVPQNPTGKIRLRRISGDILSRPVLNEPMEQIGFIKIKDVRTLTPEEENILQPEFQPEVKKVLQTKKYLVPISNNFFAKNAVSFGKTTTPEETNYIVSSSKTKKIFAEMLRFPKVLDLYKCPVELCSFSTSYKSEFWSHFAVHRWCQITNCVYCEQAISSDNILLHIEKFHSHCLFQCAFCFYRSISRQYLILHLDLAHKFETGSTKFYSLPVNKLTTYNYLLEKPEPRNITILPYKCAQVGCGSTFLLPGDFLVHLNIYHKKYLVCFYCDETRPYFVKSFHLMQHYICHSIGKYQCRFCTFGTMTMKDMLIHYMHLHPARKPICYIRQFKFQMAARVTESLDDIMEINMDQEDQPPVLSPPRKRSLNEPQENLPPKLDKIFTCEETLKESVKSKDCATVKAIDVIQINDENENQSEDVEEFLNDSAKNLHPINDEISKPKSNEILATIEIPDENPESHFTEPLVTLKHRSVESRNAVANAIDPLSVDDLNFDSEPEKNFVSTESYKCGSFDCGFKSNNFRDFKKHLFSCNLAKNNGDYQCYHCKESFKTVADLCEHIKVHENNRFQCFECDFKSAYSHLIIRHMKQSHKTSTIRFVPVDPEKINMNTDKFIVMPPKAKIKSKSETSSPENIPEKFNISKTIFGPEEIDLLPRPPVYTQEIKCKLCNYMTKVRSNILRHLQQHIDEKTVPETAPVNPVPCLEKNEKMFDKMTNLAASSHCGRMGAKPPEKIDKNVNKDEEKTYPGFVPSNKRYVCGVANCNYLTHVDTMLRHHLEALHEDELGYKCPHCQLKIPAQNSSLPIDKIIFHLKMHDLQLYKCPLCDFIHYQKHKAEKHCLDNHPEVPTNIQIIRELDSSANFEEQRQVSFPQIPENANSENISDGFKPWKCGLCNYRTNSRSEMLTHVSNVHKTKSQFKCGKCTFRCSAKNNYTHHFKSKHPNEEINIISVYYKVAETQEEKSVPQEEIIDTQFDTTPLWLRNKSTVKHIRGILLDDSKTHQKRTTPKIIEKMAELKSTIGETSRNSEELVADASKTETLKKDTKQFTKEGIKSLETDINLPATFGTAENNFYVCPVCNEFKNVNSQDFVHHLHMELKYYRCVCSYCNHRSIDDSEAKQHWLETHQPEGKEESFTLLTPDDRIDRWVENCVQFQQKEIQKQDELKEIGEEEKLPTVEQEKSLENEKLTKLQCQYCEFIGKTPQTLWKHTKRHMMYKPFQCDNCSVSFFTEKSVLQHHKIKHPNEQYSYTMLPTPEGPTIRPLKRKRASKEPESPPKTKQKVLKADTNEADILEKAEDFVNAFICFHCPRRAKDLSVIREHFYKTHGKIHNTPFKYKKLTIDKNNKTQYKCKYCPWFGHPDGLKQHHLYNHSDQTWICQKAVKYKCHFCEKIFSKVVPIRKHFLRLHPGQNICYQTVLEEKLDEVLDTTEIIEEIKTEDKPVQCEYCPDNFENSQQLLNHHNLLHSHLELKKESPTDGDLKKFKCPQCGHCSNSYPAMRDHLRAHNKPYKCSYCPVNFSYPNQLKSHHLKEHRTLPFEVQELPGTKKLIEQLRENVLVLGPDGNYSKKCGIKRNLENPEESPSKVFVLDSSLEVRKANVAKKSTTQASKIKNVARKSTSNRPVSKELQGFSFYGTKPCDINDYKNVMSEINIMGKAMPINIIAMSQIFNLCPSVHLQDLKHSNNDNLL